MSDSWASWGKHVLAELESLDGRLDKMDERLRGIEVQLAMLKVRAGVWGLAAGAIPVLIGLGVWALKG